jgi:hypothetical protein
MTCLLVELSVRCARLCAIVYHHTLTLLRQVFARCGMCTIEVARPTLRCMSMGHGVLDDMRAVVQEPFCKIDLWAK